MHDLQTAVERWTQEVIDVLLSTNFNVCFGEERRCRPPTRKTRVINKFAIADPESSLEASWICGGETSIHDVISASYDMMCVHVEMEGIIMSMTVEKEGRSLLISYMQHDNILPRTWATSCANAAAVMCHINCIILSILTPFLILPTTTLLSPTGQNRSKETRGQTQGGSSTQRSFSCNHLGMRWYRMCHSSVHPG